MDRASKDRAHLTTLSARRLSATPPQVVLNTSTLDINAVGGVHSIINSAW